MLSRVIGSQLSDSPIIDSPYSEQDDFDIQNPVPGNGMLFLAGNNMLFLEGDYMDYLGPIVPDREMLFLNSTNMLYLMTDFMNFLGG